MMQQSQTATPVVTEAALARLPEPVRRYMRWTGVVGRPWIRTAWIKQSGRFRLGLDKPWMPLSAEQTFTTEPPGLLWRARFKLYGLPLMGARDTYRDGQGHMSGKLAGLVTLFDDRSEKLTLGTQMRYLSELIWLPIAYLGDNITWTAAGDHAADMALTDHGRTVGGRMFFDGEGRPVRFETMRYREVQGEYDYLPWITTNEAFGVYEGLNLPVHSLVSWQLPEGLLTYGDIRLDEVRYNRVGDI